MLAYGIRSIHLKQAKLTGHTSFIRQICYVRCQTVCFLHVYTSSNISAMLLSTMSPILNQMHLFVGICVSLLYSCLTLTLCAILGSLVRIISSI